MDGECLSGQEFVNAIGGHIECGLNDRTFGCHHQHLFVTIPESRTDAPRVAHGEHLTAACEAAQHIAAVEERGGGAQDVGDVDVVLDVSGQVGAGESLHIGDVVDAFALAVEPVSHEFEHDVGVVVDAWMLPLAVISRNTSSTLVRLKLPHRHRFLALQLLRRMKGWTCESPLLPVVE